MHTRSPFDLSGVVTREPGEYGDDYHDRDRENRDKDAGVSAHNYLLGFVADADGAADGSAVGSCFGGGATFFVSCIVGGPSTKTTLPSETFIGRVNTSTFDSVYCGLTEPSGSTQSTYVASVLWLLKRPFGSACSTVATAPCPSQMYRTGFVSWVSAGIGKPIEGQSQRISPVPFERTTACVDRASFFRL